METKIYIVYAENRYMINEPDIYFKGVFTTKEEAKKAMECARAEYAEHKKKQSFGYEEYLEEVYIHCRELICDRYVRRLFAKNWGKDTYIPL